MRVLRVSLAAVTVALVLPAAPAAASCRGAVWTSHRLTNPAGDTVGAGRIMYGCGLAWAEATLAPRAGTMIAAMVGVSRGPGDTTVTSAASATGDVATKRLRFDPATDRVVADFAVDGDPCGMGVTSAPGPKARGW